MFTNMWIKDSDTNPTAGTQTKWVKEFIEFISAVQSAPSSLSDFTMFRKRKKEDR